MEQTIQEQVYTSDILGGNFQQTTLEFPNDFEGKVVALVRRVGPSPGFQRIRIGREMFLGPASGESAVQSHAVCKAVVVGHCRIIVLLVAIDKQIVLRHDFPGCRILVLEIVVLVVIEVVEVEE